MENIMLRKIEHADWPGILIIVKKLRGWFDNVALTFEIPNDLKLHHGFVAAIGNKVVGFITYSSFEGAVFISWVGIDPDYQRQGIGKDLIIKLEDILRKEGLTSLEVETLSAKIEYEPYEKTRSFYQKNGLQ